MILHFHQKKYIFQNNFILACSLPLRLSVEIAAFHGRLNYALPTNYLVFVVFFSVFKSRN